MSYAEEFNGLSKYEQDRETEAARALGLLYTNLKSKLEDLKEKGFTNSLTDAIDDAANALADSDLPGFLTDAAEAGVINSRKNVLGGKDFY